MYGGDILSNLGVIYGLCVFLGMVDEASLNWIEQWGSDSSDGRSVSLEKRVLPIVIGLYAHAVFDLDDRHISAARNSCFSCEG